MNRTLEIIRSADYPTLKRNLDRVWHHFSWATLYREQLTDEPFESDAFHVMLDVLCRHRKESLPKVSPLLSTPCPAPSPGYLI